MALVTVYSAASEFMALTVRDMLLEGKVAAMIKSDVIAGYNIQVGNWGEVLVEEADQNRALEMIGAFRGTLGELQDATPLDGEMDE